ncbi:MAG TPA: ABC transporter permease [Bacteroidales bacterium]|nr:ABC transporter permease [Bacteroidales bacterium]
MRRGILNIALKSIKYHRKQVFYQLLIILLLSAVITGSLMTGKSVRTSLKKTAVRKLGSTGIFISSGLRYFDRDLTYKFSEATGVKCTGLLELHGSSQGLVSQKVSNNTSIYAVSDDFFRFHNLEESIIIEPGSVIINTELASALQVKEGDEVIIRFRRISDIPADAPFAPSEDGNMSVVLKVGRIADATMMGDFSLSISQVTTPNIFMNIADVGNFTGSIPKINRLLIAGTNLNAAEVGSSLKKIIEPDDAGLHLRKVKKTGSWEILSDRVFIDDPLINEIKKIIPSATPLITYLANRIEKDGKINPYSFVAAIPPGLYKVPSQNGILLSKWLAEDLGALKGDSVLMSWYAPDSLNHLIEKNTFFLVEDVIAMNDPRVDSLLMPDFPGIAASESCSSWDAGIPVKTNLIRDKDEDYWDRYKGTPKAFINYETGKRLWGSNYGPATAIRFSEGISGEEINGLLTGSMDPETLGFTVNDIYNESLRAADQSVDFGTLFLSLGFFLILASFVLLSFAVTYYFEIKKDEVRVLYSLGYRNKTISNLFLYETIAIALIGCLAGSIAGYAVNVILITALNSVWSGAVQTNTLISSFDSVSVLTGFAATFMMTLLFMFFKIRRFLRQMNLKGTKQHSDPSLRWSIMLLAIAGLVTLILVVLSIIIPAERTTLSFVAGSMLLVTLVLFWRWFCIKGRRRKSNLSALYYSHYPSHAVSPVLFIAAGIFAVFITAVNRKDFAYEINDRSSGTGGYLLWMETSIPVEDDLNSARGRINLGLDDDSLASMQFIEMKRSPGNDASCLNLNHITAPPLLGADPGMFIHHRAFSFTKTIKKSDIENPWQLLDTKAGQNTIYGIADQTVLDWGLKIGVGDTLVLRSESGKPFNIIIAAGLQSSVFQGYVIIGKESLIRFYPSVSGNSVFLVDGQEKNMEGYRNILLERLSGNGADVEYTSDRLAAFYEITNTYLSVFGVFGGLGMITGIAGLGFVLLRNYSRRKREFALMLSVGFTPSRIRKMVLSEQLLILSAGVISGVIPAVIATLPSIDGNHEIPWMYLITIIAAIFFTGALAAYFSTGAIRENNLISALRRD